jgi:signal transduction histidine kinase
MAMSPITSSAVEGSTRQVDVAKATIERRHRARRSQLIPLRIGVVILIIVVAAFGKPAPGLHGKSLAVLTALFAFIALMILEVWPAFGRRTVIVQVSGLLFAGAAGVCLGGLQPQAAAELPASVVIFVAALRLTRRQTAIVVIPVTVALGVVISRDSNAQTVAASVFLCIVLAVFGGVVGGALKNQERAELLLAELEDARDDEADAAASAERSRIARDIHDVLAHSLSGLSIQLEAARRMAQIENTSPELRSVLERSSDLARDGLVEARSAVGALRGVETRNVARLPELIEQFRRDFELPIAFVIEGIARTPTTETGTTLYRVVSEALTNVSRHAPAASTTVLLRWEAAQIRLRVENGGSAEHGLNDAGGGWGLEGIRERVARLGGSSVFGASGDGWVVETVLPG